MIYKKFAFVKIPLSKSINRKQESNMGEKFTDFKRINLGSFFKNYFVFSLIAFVVVSKFTCSNFIILKISILFSYGMSGDVKQSLHA